MVEAEIWAVDAELGEGLLDQVGRIRADGSHVLVEGEWAEFASRRAIPDLATGEEIVIADDPERWVASLVQLIRKEGTGFLHVIEHAADGRESERAVELELAEEHTLEVPEFLRCVCGMASLCADANCIHKQATLPVEEKARRLAEQVRAELLQPKDAAETTAANWEPAAVPALILAGE